MNEDIRPDDPPVRDWLTVGSFAFVLQEDGGLRPVRILSSSQMMVAVRDLVRDQAYLMNANTLLGSLGPDGRGELIPPTHPRVAEYAAEMINMFRDAVQVIARNLQPVMAACVAAFRQIRPLIEEFERERLAASNTTSTTGPAEGGGDSQCTVGGRA